MIENQALCLVFSLLSIRRILLSAMPLSMNRRFFIISLAGGLGACRSPVSSVREGPPRVQSPAEVPLQVSTQAAEFEQSGYRLRPRAHYELQALVMSVRQYDKGELSDLIPLDWALAWGRVARPEIQAALRVHQNNRWFHWRTKGPYPVPRQELIESMANVHIVAGSVAVAQQIARVRKGQCVWLRGWLVDVEGAQLSRPWKTSLTRKDSGGGACEILHVHEIAEVPCLPSA